MLVLFACQSNPEVSTSTILEFRSEVSADTEGATEFTHEGQFFYLSESRFYEMTVYKSRDALGLPAVGFTPLPEKRQEFGDYTEALKGQRMAVLINGTILTLPTVNGRLGNGGIIEGGRGGFSLEEVDDLISRMVVNPGK